MGVGADLGDRVSTRVVHVAVIALHPHETGCQADSYPPSYY